MKIYFAIGSPDKMRIRVFTECGIRNVLVSFAETKGKAEIKLPFPDIMLDSGAYGVQTGTQKVTVQAYGLWLELYLSKYPQIKSYVNLDDLENPETSQKNQECLESCGLKPMPVYHYREPIEYLNKMCNKYKYVGLGGMAVGTMRTPDLKIFWEWVHEKFPDNDFHLFGATSMMAVSKYQPYSMDSSSWTSASRYRSIAGYKDGLPAYYKMFGDREGWEFFFKSEELWSLNIRAMLDWEKLEWLKNINGNDTDQRRLF